MGKIGDLFVRLGLKKDDYSKGLKEATREGYSFRDTLKAIGAGGKLALGYIVAGAVAVGAAIKSLAKQNQTLGDEVNRMSAGFAAMFDTLKTSVASLDFSHLLSNLREANQLARDLYDAQDAMGEIGTSYNIALAGQLKHINELKIALRDQNLTDEERIKKGEELLEIYKKLEKNPSRGLERVKDTTLDYYMQRMGVNMEGRTDKQLAAMRKKFVSFFEWLGTKQGETYAAAANTVARSGGLDSYLGRTYLSNAAKYGMEEYARLAVAYNDKMGDKDRTAVEAAVVSYYQQEAKYSGETLRIQTQINSIRAQAAQDAKGGNTPADHEYETALKVLQRAQDAAKSEVQLMQEKYEQEKALLEKYGLDAGALWDEYLQKLEDKINKAAAVKLKDFDLTIEIPEIEIDDSDFESNLDALLADINRRIEMAQDLVDGFRDAVIGGFSDACQELMDQLFGLQDANAGAIFQALLTPLADMAIKAGEIIMAEGIATEAANSALMTFGETGWAAVAAGAALVAAGAAAKSGLKALAGTGGRSTSSSSYNGSSGSGSGAHDFQTEMTVYVKGTIKGSDIVLSGQKTIDNWRR